MSDLGSSAMQVPELHVVSTKVRVLVIDDELASATLVKTLLEEDGFDVEVALSADEGLSMLEDTSYSAAIIDYRMPGKSGLDVLMALAETDSSVTTIMLTGAEEIGVAVDAMRLGAGDFLYKDPTGEYLHLLSGRIDRALERSALLLNRVEDASRLRKLNRALRILSSCNLTLVRATSEQKLLTDICNIIVNDDFFQAAWVGYLQAGDVLRMIPMASAGDHELTKKISEACALSNQSDTCPCCSAAAGEKAIFMDDFQREKRFSTWRKNLNESCTGGCLSLPLKVNGDVMGVLTILSEEADTFDHAGRQLFTELANDLAFGIEVVRTRIEKDAAEKALRDSEARMHTIVRNDADGLVVLGRNGKVVFANPAAESLLGVARGSLLGTVPDISLDEELSEKEFQHEGKPTRAIQLRQSPIDWLGYAAKLISIHDITDRNRLQRNLVDIAEAMGLALEARDPYTAGHQHRVADMAYEIGAELGLPSNMLEGIRIGGAFHDIGKIYVPSEILNRPGRLTATEFELIKTHSQVGYDIVKGIEFPWPGADMVRQHHERLDGTGYPDGLKNGSIILEARILAVADVVEAMATHRPYRASLGIEAALKEIEANAGRLYDSDVVSACVTLFNQHGYSFE